MDSPKPCGWLAFAAMAALMGVQQTADAAAAAAARVHEGSMANCAASDAMLTERRNMLCVSFAMPECCGEPVPKNVSAEGDWPNQAIYMNDLLQSLVGTDVGCLGTPVARATVTWLSDTSNATSAWWNTWVVFQVQYYDMPRKPGARIESPATLGRKCWAFDCTFVCGLVLWVGGPR